MTREDDVPSSSARRESDEPSENDLMVVAALLARAGLHPDRRELIALHASFVAMSAWCAELYDGLAPLTAGSGAQ